MFWGSHGCDLEFGHEGPHKCLYTEYDEDGEPIEENMLCCVFREEGVPTVEGEWTTWPSGQWGRDDDNGGIEWSDAQPGTGFTWDWRWRIKMLNNGAHVKESNRGQFTELNVAAGGDSA